MRIEADCRKNSRFEVCGKKCFDRGFCIVPHALEILIERFGTREQQEQTVTLRLKGRSEVVQVGEFEVKP